MKILPREHFDFLVIQSGSDHYFNPSKGIKLIFEKAYNYYRQVTEWTEERDY